MKSKGKKRAEYASKSLMRILYIGREDKLANWLCREDCWKKRREKSKPI